MRHFYIIFLLSLPCSTEAATRTVPDSAFVFQPSLMVKQDGEKRGFLKKFLEKRLLKRLAKAEKSLGKYEDGDGKWLAISGLVAGPLGLLLATFSAPLFLVLVAGGMLMSILGLVKAKRQRASGVIRGLAITGIIVNSLIIVLIALLAILAAQGWVTFLQF